MAANCQCIVISQLILIFIYSFVFIKYIKIKCLITSQLQDTHAGYFGVPVVSEFSVFVLLRVSLITDFQFFAVLFD